MADPLSIVGSVVGVASLGIPVVQSLIDFYNAYRHQQSDLATTLRNLQSLADALRHLEKNWVGRTWTDPDQCSIGRIRESITTCHAAIDELQGTCQKFTKATPSGWKQSWEVTKIQAAYPFKRSTLQKLNIDVGEVRDNLSFLLEIVQLQAAAKSQDDLADITALLKLIDGMQIAATLRDWLRAPDTTVDHNSACAKKTPGSGKWLCESLEFSSWLTQESSLLWLKGFAGSGKSVLCSTAIQSAFQHRRGDRDIGIAFFYFTFTDRSKQGLSSMLRGLLWQLSCQIPDGQQDLSQLHQTYKSGTPPDPILLAYLHRLIGRFRRSYIFLDALDECPRSEGRGDVLDAIEQIRKWDEPNTNLFVTSRDVSDIRQSLGHLADHQVEMRSAGIDSDIAGFVSRQLLEDRQLFKLARYHDQIRLALIEGARGVFRWVECQLKSLRSCPRSEDHVYRRLKSLPQSLDATYERMLCNIDSDLIEDARRILILLCFADRPLTTRELIDAIAVDTGDQPGLKVSRRLSDLDDIRDICSGFIDTNFTDSLALEKYSIPAKTETVRIAHFSVQEYLESTRILQSNAKTFGVDRVSAHSEIAQICLIYLLEEGLRSSHFDDHLVKRYPFSHFAATYWYGHYLGAATSAANLNTLVLDLFRSRQSFFTWVKLHDVERSWFTWLDFRRQTYKTTDPVYYASLLGLEHTLSTLLDDQTSPPVSEQMSRQIEVYGQALYAASSKGHQNIVQLLLDKGADINTQRGHYGNVLQAASSTGHQNIVQLLLDKGADINAQGGYLGNALQAASSEGHSKLVQLLLDEGADINAQGGHYGNALQAASRVGHSKLVQLLLDKGADINAQGGYLGNALRAASSEGHQNIVQLLLDKGADINAQGGLYGNALQAALLSGRQNIVQLLLDKGADINAQDGHYGNALQAASAHGNQNIVQLLLDRGADVNAQGGYYGNALQAASKNGHQNIEQMLLDKGASRDAESG